MCALPSTVKLAGMVPHPFDRAQPRRWIGPLAALLLAPATGQEAVAAAAEPEWESLFDGSSLEGWVQRGGKAHYAVDGDSIVGTTVAGTPNSFLCTERTFADFELELEFSVDPKLNSGIQIRSLSDLAVQHGVVHGYQVEIDPSPRAWTGGIYDESRRGWLCSLEGRDDARQAFRQGEWNRLRVRCVADHLQTWVNDVAAAELIDSQTLRGFIALQVHGVDAEAEPAQVRWRKLRLRDLGHHKWRPLFDGATTQGWRVLGAGSWEVHDGHLVGTNAKEQPGHGVLLSDRTFADCTARIRYKAIRGNSGFYFRCEPVATPVAVHGLQAEIDPQRDAGMLYETGGRGRLVVPKAEDVARWYKRDGWNEMTVASHGGHVVVHLNGAKTAELRDDPGRRHGHLGVQLHGGQDVRIEIAAIEVLVGGD